MKGEDSGEDKQQDHEAYPEFLSSWQKIVDTNRKAGFREGASVAQEDSFQKFFDIGYSTGFKAAFELGKIKGHISTQALFEADYKAFNKEVLGETKKGGCIICSSRDTVNKSVADITEAQISYLNNIVKNN